MPCRVDDPKDDPGLRSPKSLAVRYKELMCQMCKYLSVEQMNLIQSQDESYSAAETIINLLEWYKSHLTRDYKNGFNDDKREVQLISEGSRVGIDLQSIKRFNFSTRQDE